MSAEEHSVSQDNDVTSDEELDKDLDLDSTDGFRKSIKRRLAKLAGCSKEDTSESRESSSSTRESTSSQDFTETSSQYMTSSRTRAGQATSEGGADSGWDDSDVYDFSNKRRGLAVIINNENFAMARDFEDRPGSSCDAVSLKRTFKNLGFEVMSYTNLMAWKMVEVLKAAAQQYDHASSDCFVCSILTHGDQTWSTREYERLGTTVRQDLLFGVDGKAVPTKLVVELFSDKNSPNLEGKPRLFFLQACRGNKLDDGQAIIVRTPMNVPVITRRGRGGGRSQADGTDSVRDESFSSPVDPPEYQQVLADETDAKKESAAGDEGQKQSGTEKVQSGSGKGDADRADSAWSPVRDVPISPTPLYKDCLVMYATPPGHFAWRRRNGAWFVQCLCNVLDQSASLSMSLMKVLTLVSKHVAIYYQSENPSNPAMHEKKEMPVIESMLVKDIVLNVKNTGH